MAISAFPESEFEGDEGEFEGFRAPGAAAFTNIANILVR
jgi:hypothetical protein